MLRVSVERVLIHHHVFRFKACHGSSSRIEKAEVDLRFQSGIVSIRALPDHRKAPIGCHSHARDVLETGADRIDARFGTDGRTGDIVALKEDSPVRITRPHPAPDYNEISVLVGG